MVKLLTLSLLLAAAPLMAQDAPPVPSAPVPNAAVPNAVVPRATVLVMGAYDGTVDIFGAEAFVRVAGRIAAFVEGSQLVNVPQDYVTRAQAITTATGIPATVTGHMTTFDAGARVLGPNWAHVQAYVALGAGIARVQAATTFAVNGVTVTPDSVGIQLGPDLGGTVTKPLTTAGAGVTWSIARHLCGDVSIRQFWIAPRTSQIPGDQWVTTTRIAAGFGVRF